MVATSGYQMHQLPYPEHGRSTTDDEQPVGDAERRYIEKRPSELHYAYLPDQYYQGNQQKALTALEMERRTSACE